MVQSSSPTCQGEVQLADAAVHRLAEQSGDTVQLLRDEADAAPEPFRSESVGAGGVVQHVSGLRIGVQGDAGYIRSRVVVGKIEDVRSTMDEALTRLAEPNSGNFILVIQDGEKNAYASSALSGPIARQPLLWNDQPILVISL